MTTMTQAEADTLRGRRILVVEDEYMIASEIADVLAEVNAEPLGPVASVAKAEILVASELRIDGALLDVNLQGGAIWPVVDLLRARHVPILLVTGYDESVIPKPYADLPRREKPVSVQDIMRALALLVGGSPPS